MKKVAIMFLIINLILLDGLVVYYLLTSKGVFSLQKEDVAEDRLVVDSGVLPEQSNNCETSCQAYIDEKVSQILIKAAPTLAPVKINTSQNPIPVRPKVKSVSYLPIPGSGNTSNTIWTSLAGTDFYMSKNDYPGLTGVYFEANLKLTNGNGNAYFRVYDVTHSIGVAGSEISSNSQTSAFVTSGAIYQWEGNNHYVIQARSLTADTAVFESGRLKIISEN